MPQEYLLRFLEVGVIDLKGDDTKLDKLRAATKDISVALRKTPSKTVRFTMVAADPNIASTDPTIEEAMASLRKKWETVANAFTGRPVNILRAILLDAIVQAARSNEAIAVAFVNTARNALPFSETVVEAELWLEAVSELEAKIDARAESEWATPDMITVDPLQYALPVRPSASYEPPTVDRSDLKARIHSAAGPWGADPKNAHSPSNQPQQWASVFADKMSSALADVLEEVAGELEPTPVDLSGPLSSLAKAVSTYVENALASFSGATAGLERRTSLLWWKEALYSPSARSSYLDLHPFDAAALMALDLHEQVPTFSPASVSAFLREAIRCLPEEKEGAPNHKRHVASLVRGAWESGHMEPFRVLSAKYAPAPVGRGPLLSLIGHPLDSNLDNASTLYALSGMEASTEMTVSDWGAHLFRELQSARATLGKPVKPTKK